MKRLRSEDNKFEKQIVKREAKSNNKSKRFNINDVNIKIDAKKIKQKSSKQKRRQVSKDSREPDQEKDQDEVKEQFQEKEIASFQIVRNKESSGKHMIQSDKILESSSARNKGDLKPKYKESQP